VRYIITWSEQATYKTEVTVTHAELAEWANRTGLLRSTEHTTNPGYKITAEDIMAMKAANPAFHRRIIALYTNKTRILTPAGSAVVTATGQHIAEIQSQRARS
jgi:hypothetical protein